MFCYIITQGPPGESGTKGLKGVIGDKVLF